MLRTCSYVLALTAMVAGPTAQAADNTLTLACQGTATTKVFLGKFVDYEPEPISMGLIVNFTKRTVQGTARWGPWLFDDQLPITELTEGTVVFSGWSKLMGMTIRGSMDRVTGDVGMLATTKGEKSEALDYALKCKPAQRMF